MSLSRIYIDAALSVNSSVQLPVTTCHYVKNVLRLKTGENIILFNGRETAEYTAQISLQGKNVVALPTTRLFSQNESPIETTLIQAAGKPEHLDYIIQKSTEMGINRILIFNSERTQTHLKASRLEKKLDHWQKIISSACEQCGRNILPTLDFSPDLHSCLKKINHSNKILLDFNGYSVKTLVGELDIKLPFCMLTGPEGGLTAAEIQQATDADFKSCSLGPRILRMETAAISILNMIQHHFGDMP